MSEIRRKKQKWMVEIVAKLELGYTKWKDWNLRIEGRDQFETCYIWRKVKRANIRIQCQLCDGRRYRDGLSN